jgi:NAD(P)-dependent dehydrogenase (short-subunit alcohol dehydrogenase family)
LLNASPSGAVTRFLRSDRQGGKVMSRPRVAVITGGSAGVGRATARAFADAGYRVALLARGEDRLRAACAELLAAGHAALGQVVDVADAAQVERAAERVERELGEISVWVNNAATTVFGPVVDITAEEFEQVTRVTYLGTVHGTLAALRRMRPRGRGCIVQVGSALAYRSIPLQSAYCAAKAAIRGFTDSLRSELIREQSQVQLTMVHLSAFNTPQFDWARSRLPRQLQPVPPIFQPEVAADAIVHAARHPRREFWVGWPAVKAILSTRLVPGLGDRLAASTAYDGQQTPEPAVADRPDNLFAPVAGGYAAHGRFDAQARRRSLQWHLSKHRGSLAMLALAAIAATAASRHAITVPAGTQVGPLRGSSARR